MHRLFNKGISPHASTLFIIGASIALASCSSIRVTVQPGEQTVEAGATAVFTVQITRDRFPDPVPLSLSPASSPHYTTSLQPNPVTGNQAQLTVQVSSTAPIGAYALDVESTPPTRPPPYGVPPNRARLVVGPCGARWLRQFGTSESDFAGSIKRRANGDVFVLTRQDRDSFAMRFDSNGSLAWQEPIPGASVMDVDPQGNLLVAATVVQNNRIQYQLRRYTPLGSLDWTVTLGTDPQRINRLTGLATDGAGNVFVVGFTTGDLGGSNPDNTHTNWEGWIAKTDPRGTLLWLRQTLTFDHDLYGDVAVDNAGGVYVLGVFSTASPFLRKLDAATGDLVWAENLPSPSFAWGALAVDATGDIYVAIDGQQPAAGVGPLLRKYSPGQAQLWSASLDARGIVIPQGLAIDASGGPIVVGFGFQGSTQGNTRIASFDANGTPGWGLTFDAPYSIVAGDHPIDVGPAGELYLAGSTDGSLGGQNAGRADAWIGRLRQGGCEVDPVPR
jgi:outer membrane protein assembly factor BamB